MKVIACIAGTAILLAGPTGTARAQEQSQQGFYLGVSAGQSDIDGSMAEGLITSGSSDGGSSGYKVLAGYRFNKHFALEGAFVDLGKLSYQGNYLGATVTGGTVKVSGVSFAAMGIIPVSTDFDLFAKVGAVGWTAKASDTTGGVPFSASRSDGGLTVGVGAAYYFTRHFGARLEWDYYDLDGTKASLLSAGAVLRF